LDIHTVISAVGLSLLCAVVAVALCILPSIRLALLLADRRFRGKAIVEMAVMLPVVVPPVVTGYLLLVLLGRRGLLGPLLQAANVNIAFTWFGAALAQAVIALPFLVMTLRVAFESIDPELKQMAMTMGATRWQVLWNVTLPMAGPGMMAGCMLAMARALGEFGATIIIAGNIAGQTRTLPLAIYTALNVPGGEATAAVLVAVSIVLACATLGLSRLLTGRQWSGFRVQDRRISPREL
jgi:molybdate transport system permease protein